LAALISYPVVRRNIIYVFSNQLPLNYNTENVLYIYPAILKCFMFTNKQRPIFLLQIPFLLALKAGLMDSSVGYRYYLSISL
jgi:hypothetical protein